MAKTANEIVADQAKNAREAAARQWDYRKDHLALSAQALRRASECGDLAVQFEAAAEHLERLAKELEQKPA